MKIKAINIQYDLSDLPYDKTTLRLESSLPKVLTFEVDSDFDPEYELADLVTDETGYCVTDLGYEIEEDEDEEAMFEEQEEDEDEEAMFEEQEEDDRIDEWMKGH